MNVCVCVCVCVLIDRWLITTHHMDKYFMHAAAVQNSLHLTQALYTGHEHIQLEKKGMHHGAMHEQYMCIHQHRLSHECIHVYVCLSTSVYVCVYACVIECKCMCMHVCVLRARDMLTV